MGFSYWRHYLDMHFGVLFFILPDITSTCMLGFSYWRHYLDMHFGVLFFILPDITSTCMLGFSSLSFQTLPRHACWGSFLYPSRHYLDMHVGVSNWGHYFDVHVGVLFFILPDIDLVKFQVTLHFRPRAKTGCFSERFTVSDEGVRLFCCQHFLHFFWET